MDERDVLYHLKYRQQDFQREAEIQRRLRPRQHNSGGWQWIKSMLRLGSRTVDKLTTAEIGVLSQRELESRQG